MKFYYYLSKRKKNNYHKNEHKPNTRNSMLLVEALCS